MTEFLKSWIMSLSGVIIFGSMCEMILPNGVYKKYIRLVIGIMLVAALLSPFVGQDISVEISEFADSSSTEDIANQRLMEDVIAIYRQKLCDKIREDIGEGADIECEICEEEKDFGSIVSVKIVTDKEISKDTQERLAEKYGLSKEQITIEYIG